MVGQRASLTWGLGTGDDHAFDVALNVRKRTSRLVGPAKNNRFGALVVPGMTNMWGYQSCSNGASVNRVN